MTTPTETAVERVEEKRCDPVQRFDMGGTAYGEMKNNSQGDYVPYDDAIAIARALVAQADTLKCAREALKSCKQIKHADCTGLSEVEYNTFDATLVASALAKLKAL